MCLHSPLTVWPWTMSTILKHHEAIKAADVAKGLKVGTKEEMKKLVEVWIIENRYPDTNPPFYIRRTTMNNTR